MGQGMTWPVKCEAYFTGLERINEVVNWRNIEALLLEHYDVRSLKNKRDQRNKPDKPDPPDKPNKGKRVN